jgi:hypothetical protein
MAFRRSIEPMAGNGDLNWVQLQPAYGSTFVKLSTLNPASEGDRETGMASYSTGGNLFCGRRWQEVAR